jgi:hypothetical protein
VVTAWVGSISFLLVVVLYIMLILGLPYGEFAMGGKFKVLPSKMRAACIVSVLIQLIAILFLLQAGKVINFGLPYNISKGVCFFFSGYLVLNTIMNLMSKSKKEKFVMTPISFITSICFFLTALNI